MIIIIMTMMMIITSILLYWCTGFLISLSADDPRLLLVCRAGGTASTFYREELSFILKNTKNLKFCSPAGWSLWTETGLCSNWGWQKLLRSPPGKLGCSAPSPVQDGHHHHPDNHHGDFDDDIISIKSCQAQCSCSESSSNLISCTCIFSVLVFNCFLSVFFLFTSKLTLMLT